VLRMGRCSTSPQWKRDWILSWKWFKRRITPESSSDRLEDNIQIPIVQQGVRKATFSHISKNVQWNLILWAVVISLNMVNIPMNICFIRWKYIR
jgi:hypothetical protein